MVIIDEISPQSFNSITSFIEKYYAIMHHHLRHHTYTSSHALQPDTLHFGILLNFTRTYVQFPARDSSMGAKFFYLEFKF